MDSLSECIQHWIRIAVGFKERLREQQGLTTDLIADYTAGERNARAKAQLYLEALPHVAEGLSAAQSIAYGDVYDDGRDELEKIAHQQKQF